MNHQRKRFNYLSSHQRTLNFEQNTKPSLPLTTSHSNLTNSTANPSFGKQFQTDTKQSYTASSRKSSLNKTSHPLQQLNQNIGLYDIKSSASKVHGTNKKDNYMLTSITKLDTITLTNSINHQSKTQLQTKIKQLQKQNWLLIKQTEQKFMLMQKQLQKVESILKEKERVIEELATDNKRLTAENQELTSAKIHLNDQKREILKIIAEKNKQINNLNTEIHKLTLKETQSTQKINHLVQQNLTLLSQTKEIKPELMRDNSSIQIKRLFQVTETQNQHLQEEIIKQSSSKDSQNKQIQTELCNCQIEQMMQRCHELEIDSKLNYRQKYESLFKKALQMEDQIYELKEQLFDKQSEVKTLQQQFNTFKIFNQIDRLSQS